MKPHWWSSTRGISQIWLQVREHSIVEPFWESCYLCWRPTGTYCVNMAITEIVFLKIWWFWCNFFQENPLHEPKFSKLVQNMYILQNYVTNYNTWSTAHAIVLINRWSLHTRTWELFFSFFLFPISSILLCVSGVCRWNQQQQQKYYMTHQTFFFFFFFFHKLRWCRSWSQSWTWLAWFHQLCSLGRGHDSWAWSIRPASKRDTLEKCSSLLDLKFSVCVHQLDILPCKNISHVQV